jgi:hypothetical protein
MNKVILLVLLIASALSQSDYNPHFDQKPNSWTLNIDRATLPFKDKIDDPYGAFKVTAIDPDTLGKDGIEKEEGSATEFQSEDHKSVVVATNSSVVSIHFLIKIFNFIAFK